MQNPLVNKKLLNKFCFEVLIASLTQIPPPELNQWLKNIIAPLFVTWTYTKNHDLRGCIGTFFPQKLETSLPKYALTSAIKDPRFKPISIDEIQQLTVQVSLLINFQKYKKALQWQVGKHGILIQFTENNIDYNGTFLPQVAVQQQWTQQQTLKHLIRKAGYKGNYKKIMDNIVLTTYESTKTKLSYPQYLQMISSQHIIKK